MYTRSRCFALPQLAWERDDSEHQTPNRSGAGRAAFFPIGLTVLSACAGGSTAW